MLNGTTFGERLSFAALLAGAVLAAPFSSRASEADTARGKYLATIAGCNDCHTPGIF